VKRGAQIRGRTNKSVEIKNKVSIWRRRVILTAALVISGSIIAGIFLQKRFNKPLAVLITEGVSKSVMPAITPHSLAELLALSPADLNHCDIARMNLLCAEGLPGADNLNVEKCLAELDQWAEGIKFETKRNYHHFREDPGYFYNSENFYRMLMIAVVLYEDYQVRYNPKWIESPETIRLGDGFGADSRDILIHGLMGSQHMGTCSSMPVLYIALARRLGYPVKLVTTKAHLFMRWDGSTERFDMDATGKGLNEYNDDHFKQWPFPVTEQDIKDDGYLQSLTAAQELSVFLRIRAFCLREAGRLNEARAAHVAALKLEPNWRGNQVLLAQADQEMAAASVVGPNQNFKDAMQSLQEIDDINRLNRAALGNSGDHFAPNPTPHLPNPK